MNKPFLNLFRKTLSLILIFVMFSVAAFAQRITVNGKVADGNGEPLIGVNVSVKGTTMGIITDVDGNYTLQVPANGTLVFSYIGYKTQEIIVGNRTTINVIMKEDTEQIEEVVVVGYGVQKKVTVTGAVATISGKDLQVSPTSNLSNGMVGRIPGVIGFQTADEPGGGASTIRIRGTNSLGSKDPLVVIDGIPDRAGGLNRLNPNEIESMSVLKDAAAAIYGARGANGVILITTKRGKEGKAVVNFDASYGFSRANRLPKMCNAFEYATMVNEINPGTWSEKDLESFKNHDDPWDHPDTDWFDTTIKSFSPTYRTDMGVQGGSEKFKFYVNLSANGEDGIYRRSSNRFDQYAIRTNLDFKLSEYVSISVGNEMRLEDTHYPMKSAGSIFSGIRRGKPTQVAFWPTGQAGPDLERGDNPAVTSTDEAGTDRQKNYYVQNNITGIFKIPGVEGLTLTGTASYDKHFFNRSRFEKPVILYTRDTSKPKDASSLTGARRYIDAPRYSKYVNDYTDWMLNVTANYERTFDSHTFGIMAGVEGQSKEMEYMYARRQNYVSGAKAELSLGSAEGMENEGYSWKETRLNYFGRVNYNYLERYLIEFVWRYDGSYRFPKAHRYGFFPGVSAAWRMSEESWFKEHIHFITYAKLRGSISQTGNDALLDSDGNYDRSIQYLDTYAFTTQGVVFGNEEQRRLYPSRTPNPDITWERGTTYDIGLDLRFLNDRLSIEADYFYHKRTHMLISRNASLPQVTGITLPRENIGRMRNQGFEMLVSWQDRKGDFNYGASFNMTWANNKILYWDEVPGIPEYQKSTGMPVGARLYYKTDGIFHTQQEIDAYPHWTGAVPGDVKFVDVNKDGAIDANDRVRSNKTYEPKFVGGLTLTAGYKNWDLSALIQGALGGQAYIKTWSGTIGNFLKEYYDNRWTPENPNAKGPRTYERENQYWAGSYEGDHANDFFLRSGDYLRLKNLEIGYAVGEKTLKAIGFSKLRFYVSGRNLLTLDHIKVADPESRNPNLENYPQRVFYHIGFQATF